MFQIPKIVAVSCLCSSFFYPVSAKSSLSLEERVGQVLMVHFHGEVANEEAKVLIESAKVGGIIYYNWSNGLHSPEQIKTLSLGLQKLAKTPLLIAADQEGGVVSRLGYGFTRFPGNKALGMTGYPHLAEAAAFATGQEMKAVGINMNLAPVVDINSNPRNPVIGVRSFGECPETVFAFGEKALQGYKAAHVIATLKHFPGHGDVSIDSHEDLPVVYKSKKELEEGELIPFAKLSSSAEAIMTAHILVPALDKDHCSTLSEKTLTYLRKDLGFKGVIVSDSLVMDGVLKQCHTVDEAAIQALNAGCDLLILGGKLLNGEHAGFELSVRDVQRVHSSLIDAVKSGRIKEERLNQAVEKILALKQRYLGLESLASDKEDYAFIAQTIAALSLQKVQGKPISLQDKKVCVFAPQLLKDQIEQTSLLQLGYSTETSFFSGLNPSSIELEVAKEADVLIVCSYNAWKNPSQEAMIHALLEVGKPVILLATRDPLDSPLFEKAHTIFNLFSPTAPSIQAACDDLTLVSSQTVSQKELEP